MSAMSPEIKKPYKDKTAVFTIDLKLMIASIKGTYPRIMDY
jgi:hypothetical protein